MLVGGGELHERWETLVQVRAPLSRGIQRFTGITQAMVDEAPPAEATLPELAEPAARPRARRPQRELRPPRAAPGVRAGRARVARPAGAVHGRAGAPARTRSRASASCARSPESLGIEVEVAHRALADAETCARVFCALFGRLCANARDGRRRARPAAPGAAAAPAPGRDGRRRAHRAARAGGCPTSADLPDTPGVYVFRNAEGQPLYVGKSVRVRSRARAHFAPSSPTGGWTAQAATSTTARRSPSSARCCSRAGSSSALRPPGNVRLQARRPLRLPALPLRHRVPGARGRARAGGRPRGQRRAAARARGGGRAQGAARLAVRPAPLRPRRCRAATSGRRPTARWAAACRRASATSTRTSTAAGSTRRSALFTGGATARRALLAPRRRQMRAAAAAERFERAAWLRRRRDAAARAARAPGRVLRGDARAPAARARRRTRGARARRVLARRRARRRLGPARAARRRRRADARALRGGDGRPDRLAPRRRGRRGAHRLDVARGHDARSLDLSRSSPRDALAAFLGESGADLAGDGAGAPAHVGMGEAQHGVAGEPERVRGRAVPLKGGGRRVGLEAVGLDDDALGRPQEVHAAARERLRVSGRGIPWRSQRASSSSSSTDWAGVRPSSSARSPRERRRSRTACTEAGWTRRRNCASRTALASAASSRTCARSARAASRGGDRDPLAGRPVGVAERRLVRADAGHTAVTARGDVGDAVGGEDSPQRPVRAVVGRARSVAARQDGCEPPRRRGAGIVPDRVDGAAQPKQPPDDSRRWTWRAETPIARSCGRETTAVLATCEAGDRPVIRS